MQAATTAPATSAAPTVPDVVGQPFDRAERGLKAAGFEVAVVPESLQPGDPDIGRVVRTVPPAHSFGSGTVTVHLGIDDQDGDLLSPPIDKCDADPAPENPTGCPDVVPLQLALSFPGTGCIAKVQASNSTDQPAVGVRLVYLAVDGEVIVDEPRQPTAIEPRGVATMFEYTQGKEGELQEVSIAVTQSRTRTEAVIQAKLCYTDDR